MNITINNKNLSATISSLGAELIELKKDKKNILWCRDKAYWADSALVLFPFIGRNYNDTYIYANKEYNMPIHGFSTRSEFSIEKQSQNSLTLSLTDSQETFKNYPFNFKFSVEYVLNDEGLNVYFTITNKSKEIMPFTCGFHPGFQLESELENYKIYFPNASKPKEISIVTKCMLTGEIKDLKLDNNYLSLSKDLFTNSAKVLTGLGDIAILLNKNNKPIVELDFTNFENIVLWQTLNSDARFICIEGWRGLPGTYEHIDDISKVENKTFLKPNEVATYKTTIKF